MQIWFKKLILIMATILFFGINSVAENSMQVLTVKDQPTSAGPSEYFTGKVEVARLITGESPSDLTCGSVKFEAGARSNWHTHPKGQLLVVTSGHGLVQEWDKPVRKIKVGDVVWTPPNVKHWHGASAKHSMTHTAVTETLDGKAVEWMERVTDEQYKGKKKKTEMRTSESKNLLRHRI